jgi:HEAT repeat protein
VQGSSRLETNHYRQMDTVTRRRFLANCVREDSTDLSDRFVVLSLGWEPDPTARWFLIKAAGVLHLDASVPLLLQICQAPDVEMDETSLHAICAWSLGRIGDSATSEVMKLLSNADSETRRCAADTLGEIRAAAAIPALISALRHDERRVQLWAGLALAKIGVECVPLLERAVEETEGVPRLIALDALAKIASNYSTEGYR